MGICSVKNSAFCGAVVATGSRVGGIAGSGYDGSGTAPNTPVVTIMNCYVAADITGLNQIGGILGAEPGCECCWDNGFGYVSNNHFYGSIRATYPDATEGGIIGFLKSFNKYQGIENNYYLDSCGADSGIGKIETIITKDHAKYGTKFGIDYIFNADEICIASTEEEFADGSITALLNAGGSSTGNWIQGATYPVFADGPVLVGITLSGSYKTEYILGESFSNAGMTVTASYSDGAIVPLNLEDVTFSGFDSTVKGVKTITVKYLSAQTSYTVRVTSGESGNTKINVSFSLLGAPADGENGAVHTLSSDNLITWIDEKVYTVSVDATVRVVFETALTEAGLTWSNPSGNYVKSITKDGVTLAEFTNGNYSGWMYTLNGTHPLLGIDEQYLNDGDIIVFHYTDDYTKEEGTDKWDNGGTRNAAKPTITPTITVKNGEASAILSEADIDAIINAAGENGATNITISAKTDQPVTKSTVVLPSGSVSDIASAGMSLIVETSTGNFDIDNNALEAIAAEGGGSFTMSAEQLDPASLSEVNRELVGNHPVFDLTITVGGKKIIDFGNGIVTVSLPYTPAAGEDTDNLAVYYIDENGGATEMSGAYYDAATGCIVFKTSHFSKFAVVYHQTWMNPFTDVSESDWYYDSVGYVFKNGLFSGTSPTTFSPDTPMTRAMLVTVLYRLEGLPMVMGTNRFTDVESGQWYTDAVIWANTNGIVEGYDDGRFGPNDNITREQMAAILYRYATYKGYDTSASTDLTAYADMSAVSVWALEAMKWAVAKGLITGMESTTLAPTETATRAQVATLLQRFGENIAK
jgi:hypothetical protein